MELKLGTTKIEFKRPAQETKRLSVLLWGDAGVFKTTLAATAPGRKLILNFDDNGPSVLTYPESMGEDIQVADFSGMPFSDSTHFNDQNVFGLKSMLGDFDTLIVDSLTNAAYLALKQGMAQPAGTNKFGAASRQAYGTRSTLTISLIKNLLAMTLPAKKHIIFIAHESVEETGPEEQKIRYMTVNLGNNLTNSAAINIGEVWNCYVNERNRVIAVRNTGLRKPMKSRMWQQDVKAPTFNWTFDALDWHKAGNETMRLDTWHRMWAHALTKMPLPGSDGFNKLLKETNT